MSRPAPPTARIADGPALSVKDFPATLLWAKEKSERLRRVAAQHKPAALEEAIARVNSESEYLQVLGQAVVWGVAVANVDETYVYLQREWHGLFFEPPITFLRLSLSNRNGALEIGKEISRDLAKTLAPRESLRITGRLGSVGVVRTPDGFAIQVVVENARSDARANEHLSQQHEPLQDARSNNNLGLILMTQGESLQAEARLRRALVIDPDYNDAHFNMAQVLVRNGHREEAIQHYQACLNAGTWFVPHVYNNLAVLLQDKGDREGAIRYRELSVRYDPCNPDKRLALAECLEKADPGRAAKLRREAAQLQRDAPTISQADLLRVEACYETGELLERVGRSSDAIREYRKALEINPKHEDARSRLKALEKAGREPSAD